MPTSPLCFASSIERRPWPAPAPDTGACLGVGDGGGDAVWATLDSDSSGGGGGGGGGRTDEPERLRRCFEPDLALEAVGTRLVSDLLAVSLVSTLMLGGVAEDSRGLSALPLPGIFDRMEPRRDRDDSLVSVLLSGGYESRSSPVRLVADGDDGSSPELETFFDCGWPMVTADLARDPFSRPTESPALRPRPFESSSWWGGGPVSVAKGGLDGFEQRRGDGGRVRGLERSISRRAEPDIDGGGGTWVGSSDEILWRFKERRQETKETSLGEGSQERRCGGRG